MQILKGRLLYGSKLGNLYIAILAFHLGTAMDLQAERGSSGKLRICVFRSRLAIDPACKGVALCLDPEGVPLTLGSHKLLRLLGLAGLGVSRFATGVKRAGHIDTQAAGYSQLKLDLWLTHLDACVDATVRRWLPSHIEFEYEVLVGLFRPKVMTLLGWIVFADEHLVFNTPEFCGTFSLKVGQVLAIEERYKLGFFGDASDSECSHDGKGKDDRAKQVGVSHKFALTIWSELGYE